MQQKELETQALETTIKNHDEATQQDANAPAMAINNQKTQHKTPCQVIKQTKEFVSNSQSNRHDDDFIKPCRSFDNEEWCKNNDKPNDNSDRKQVRIITPPKGNKHWSCSGCAGTNMHNYTKCWKCGAEK